MTEIFATFFRGLIHIAIVTVVVAATWSVYIYRAPIAGALQPVVRLFQSEPGNADEPARAAATVPATAEPVAPPAANNTLPSGSTGNSTAN